MTTPDPILSAQVYLPVYVTLERAGADAPWRAVSAGVDLEGAPWPYSGDAEQSVYLPELDSWAHDVETDELAGLDLYALGMIADAALTATIDQEPEADQ